MKEVLLDTDILSYYIKGDKIVAANISTYLDYFPSLNISLISYYEITSGLKFKKATKQLWVFEQFCIENKVLPLTKESVQIAGDLYAQLRIQGTPVDDMDLLIASIALEDKLDVVTNNTKHFEKIPRLSILNWKKENS